MSSKMSRLTLVRNTFAAKDKIFSYTKRNENRDSIYNVICRMCTIHNQANASTNTGPTEKMHVPVLVDEVVNVIHPQNGQVIVDMTFGAGGHTKALLAEAPSARIFAVDRDPRAHKLATQLAEHNDHVTPLLGHFSEVHKLLAPHGIGENGVDAMLMDLGASSMQFDEAERGFSLSKDGPLDMRMDGDRDPNQPTAEDVINHIKEPALVKILKKYGEERRAQLVARSIIDSRYAFGRITTTKQLANVVATAFPEAYHNDKMNRKAHVATRTFQALRIFVNNELNEINNGLEIAYRLLKPGGLCLALSFHSLEDRIVKRHFHGIDMDEKFNLSISAKFRSASLIHSRETLEAATVKRWEPISKKIQKPTFDQMKENPRARSAKLRAANKI